MEKTGNYKNGQLSGTWTYWNESGAKFMEESYEEDQKDGPFVLFDDGMKIRKGMYKNGKKNGLFIDWENNNANNDMIKYMQIKRWGPYEDRLDKYITKTTNW